MSPPGTSSGRTSVPPHEERARATPTAVSLQTVLCQLMLHRVHDLLQRDALLIFFIAGADVDRSRFDRALADRNADGDADQVRVRELDARRGFAIIPEDFQSSL